MVYITEIKIPAKKINKLTRNIVQFLDQKSNSYYHVVNLNPETYIFAIKDPSYKTIINHANEILIDGIGIKILAKIKGIPAGEKLAGTDFMLKLIALSVKRKERVMFLGGFGKTAMKAAAHFQEKYPFLKIASFEGAKNIRSSSKQEESYAIELIHKFKPHYLFVAYGPPWQERWIYQHKDDLRGIVCMGVGGSFNFFSSKAIRAPVYVIKSNFEWLWRFIFEPVRTLKKGPTYIYFVIYSFFLFLSMLPSKICFRRRKITEIKT
ncbi:MAG: WecB/TagA/CpsF family glycosyltransferase [Patescibacteria group bacterium]